MNRRFRPRTLPSPRRRRAWLRLALLSILVLPSAASRGGADEGSSRDLFYTSQAEENHIRQPNAVKTAAGTVLVTLNAGSTTLLDGSSPRFALLRSTDGGVTWSDPIHPYVEPDPASAVSHPSLIACGNGDVLLMFLRGAHTPGIGWTHGPDQVWIARSADDGRTWSPATEITASTLGVSNKYAGDVSSADDNGSGLIRITTPRAHGLATGYKVRLSGVGGTTEAEGDWIVTVINPTQFDLRGGEFTHTYTSGGTFEAVWQWSCIGTTHGIRLRSGRLFMPCYHRYVRDRGGPAYYHAIYSDDDGVTWRVGAVIDETVPANEDALEPQAVETATDGHLYLTFRMKKGAYRGHARSVDGGLTVSDVTLDDGKGGTTALHQLKDSGVSGGVESLGGGNYLLAVAEGTVRRERLTVRLSTDDCATWGTKRVLFYGASAYCDIVPLDRETALIVYERGHSEQALGRAAWAEKIGIRRVTLGQVLDPEPDEHLWHFHEQAPGPALAGGPTVRDYGPTDWRPTPMGALSYGPGAAPGSVAAVFAPGGYLRLSEPKWTTMHLAQHPDSTGSFTLEYLARTRGDGVLWGGATSGARITLEVASGKLKLTVSDGTNTSTITGATTVSDDTWRRLACVRDKTNHALHLYVDGVPDAAPVADTVSATGLSNASEVRIGRHADGTGQFLGRIDWVRVTRAPRAPAELLPASYVEAGDRKPPDPEPPVAEPALWVPSPNPGNFFADLATSSRYQAPLRSSYVAHSTLDQGVNRHRLVLASLYRYVHFGHDPIVGDYWDHRPRTTVAGAHWAIEDQPASAFDFVQNQAVATISAFLKVDDTLKGLQFLASTNHGNRALNGFSLARIAANGRLRFHLSDSGSTRYDVTLADKAVRVGTWYHVAVVLSGHGRPVTWYLTEVAAPGTPVNRYTSSAVGGSDGTFHATSPLKIGYGATSGAFRGGLKNFFLFDKALNPAQIQALYDYRK